MSPSKNRRAIAADYLTALTDAEAADFLTEARPDVFETVHIVTYPHVCISGRDLVDVDENAPGAYVASMFEAGAILPDGIRPSTLEHLVRQRLVVAINVPIPNTEE